MQQFDGRTGRKGRGRGRGRTGRTVTPANFELNERFTAPAVLASIHFSL